jgi:hypothetical protein
MSRRCKSAVRATQQLARGRPCTVRTDDDVKFEGDAGRRRRTREGEWDLGVVIGEMSEFETMFPMDRARVQRIEQQLAQLPAIYFWAASTRALLDPRRGTFRWAEVLRQLCRARP